ncbi:unnamed protein product [Symbiodinium sp. CCMP2456]|nr:unnamed protein product [Symbiodinium sp. CCMP2456]
MQGQPGSTARPTPNRRDLRKYARLFVKTDQDGDGFVSSDEAYSLFTKSQLPEHTLQQVWVLSNVSGSGMLSFPEFIAAMHLIREARQTQQSPTAISGELSAFLGGISESAQDLSLEGNSRSARTLRSPVAFQGAGSSPHFGHALPAAPAESFGLSHSPELPELPQTPFQPEPEDPAAGLEDGKKKKGRKKDRKEKKETPGPDQGQPEVSEPWDSGKVGSAAEPDFGSAAANWTTFGDQHTPPEAGKEKKEKKERKERKDRDRGQQWDKDIKDDGQTRFQPQASAAWPSTDEHWSKPLPPENPSLGGFGGFGTAGGALQASQPQTRMGLRFDLDFGKNADPDYMARLQEIHLRPDSPPVTSPKKAEADGWAGRRHDGHFEKRYETAYKHMGDYASPALHVALMGFRSAQTQAQAPAVLPEPGRPFLKTMTPHFTVQPPMPPTRVLEVGKEAMTRSLGRLTFAPMTAA